MAFQSLLLQTAFGAVHWDVLQKLSGIGWTLVIDFSPESPLDI